MKIADVNREKISLSSALVTFLFYHKRRIKRNLLYFHLNFQLLILKNYGSIYLFDEPRGQNCPT